VARFLLSGRLKPSPARSEPDNDRFTQDHIARTSIGSSMPNCLALFMALLAAALGSLSSTELNAQNRVALVIGNDRYPNLPADRQLQKAVNDARGMSEALQRLGFNVIRGENLGRTQMVDSIVRFTRTIKPGDIALVFFAGHGVSLSGAN
jgi:hypothetical protein